MHIVSGVQGLRRRRSRRVRSVRRGVPGRHARRRAEGARDAAHRRARADGARPLRRHGRLLRQERQHGPGHHDSHDGVRRRRVQLPGRRRHRRRQRARDGVPRSARQERDLCAGPSSSPRRDYERPAAADRQLRLLHLQPRAGVPRARGRGARLPQRRADGGRRAEARSRRIS